MSCDWSPVTRGPSVAEYLLLHGPSCVSKLSATALNTCRWHPVTRPSEPQRIDGCQLFFRRQAPEVPQGLVQDLCGRVPLIFCHHFVNLRVMIPLDFPLHPPDSLVRLCHLMRLVNTPPLFYQKLPEKSQKSTPLPRRKMFQKNPKMYQKTSGGFLIFFLRFLRGFRYIFREGFGAKQGRGSTFLVFFPYILSGL